MDFAQLLREAKAAEDDEGRLLPAIQSVIDDESSIFGKPVSITLQNTIPSTDRIPIENASAWIKVPDVICCFVDMKNSTQLSASLHPSTTAKAYRYFTQTAVKIFHEFNSPYIDIKGDGVFALFNSTQPHTALAAIVSFKTFVDSYFIPKMKDQAGGEVDIGGHYGIDQKTVMVRKIGLKRYGDRTDRQNEVWAGKPINMAAKLASRSKNEEIFISNRFYKNLTADQALYSCGCPNGEKQSLWQSYDVSDDDRFDFDTAYYLQSNWCKTHGKNFCTELVKQDES